MCAEGRSRDVCLARTVREWAGLRRAWEARLQNRALQVRFLPGLFVGQALSSFAVEYCVASWVQLLVRPLALFMYWTGWRRGEVLSREWRHVDLKAGVIRLEPGETKNGKGRDFPYTLVPELKAVIELQRTYTDAVERRAGRIVPFVFHREGRPMKSFRSAWRLACKRVALAALNSRRSSRDMAIWKAMSREERREFKGLGRIPHDFRRTAVRNLVRAGVSQKVAMELTGHLTPSVFERYNITDDRDRRDAVAKLAAAAQDKQVVPLKRRAAAK